MTFILAGACVIGMSIERMAADWPPDLARIQFALLNAAVGAMLASCGWFRLQQAKAESPEVGWRLFLHDDLVTLSIVCVILSAVMAIPAETRETLLRYLAQVAEALMEWPGYGMHAFTPRG